MGRLADAMGAIFLGYSTLHFYHNNRGVEGLEAVTEHAMLRLEYEAQQALEAARANFPGPLGGVAGAVMGAACFPLGSITKPYSLPKDELTKEVSALFTRPSEVNSLFTELIYTRDVSEGRHQVSDLLRAMPVCCEADSIASACRKEGRDPTADELKVLDEAERARDMLIQVDVFEHATEEEKQKGYVRPAIKGTEEMLGRSEVKNFGEFAM